MQMYMSKPRLSVVTAAWANRPSAAVRGALFFATDVGDNGALFQANGSSWVPAGPSLLSGSGVASSVTGTTNETTLATVTIPAGVMGVSGGLWLRSSWAYPNSANAKTTRARLGGIGGTAFLQLAHSTALSWQDSRTIRNRGSASSQVGSCAINASNPFSVSTTALPTGTIDTSAETTLVFTGQLGSAAETLTLESYEVWLVP